MIFFTSDLHLGHANAIKYTNRPFCDVYEMDNMLIQNINDTVKPRDELYILGDFSFKLKKEDVRALRNQIQCKHVYLIRGNHDRDYSDAGIFQSVNDYKELKTEYGRIILFHYPIQEWSAMHYGSLHLHGHIHSTGEYNTENLQKSYVSRFHLPKPSQTNLGFRIYDVGVDANNYKPVSLEQIAEMMHLSPVK